MHDIKSEYLTLPTEFDIPLELQSQLIEHLTPFLTPRRRWRIETVLSQRTRYVTVALENLHKPHNASAIIRSCDSFGVQDIHIIDTMQQFMLRRSATSGAHQWITSHFYNESQENRPNVATCIDTLHAQGYRVAATTLRPDTKPLHELSLDSKVALLFGTELYGLTDEAHELADEFVQIPLHGFTDSLNISVAAAICCSNLTNRLRIEGKDWGLSSAEKERLTLQWMLNTIDHADEILDHFIAKAG